jgi:hypothetical protein
MFHVRRGGTLEFSIDRQKNLRPMQGCESLQCPFQGREKFALVQVTFDLPVDFVGGDEFGVWRKGVFRVGLVSARGIVDDRYVVGHRVRPNDRSFLARSHSMTCVLFEIVRKILYEDRKNIVSPCESLGIAHVHTPATSDDRRSYDGTMEDTIALAVTESTPSDFLVFKGFFA